MSNNLLTTVQVEGWILVLLLAIKVPLVIFTSSPLKSFCWLYFCSPPPPPQHFSQLFCNEVVNHMNRYLILFGFYLLQNILIEWFPITLIKSSYEKKGISLSFFVSSVKWSLLSVNQLCWDETLYSIYSLYMEVALDIWKDFQLCFGTSFSTTFSTSLLSFSNYSSEHCIQYSRCWKQIYTAAYYFIDDFRCQ